jgi:hypothetical protein
MNDVREDQFSPMGGRDRDRHRGAHGWLVGGVQLHRHHPADHHYHDDHHHPDHDDDHRSSR